MRIKYTPLILLVLTQFVFITFSVGQDVYYWSGKKKIKLSKDSTETIVYLTKGFDSDQVKSKIIGLE
jgi:hypothetical protein